MRAWWDSTARTVTCAGCWNRVAAPTPPASIGGPSPLDCGQPGRSLDRESERRRSNRERRTREAHPHIGGLLLALREAPQHELAFRQGAAGERAVAEALAKRTSDRPVVILHNRRMTGGLGDIDHIAIAPTGVYVIDTKNWAGRVEIKTPWFGEPKLLIGGRDCTRLIDGLERQLAAVGAALDSGGQTAIPPGRHPRGVRHPVGDRDLPVAFPRLQGVLCFTRADLPFLRPQKLRGHLLLYRRALIRRLNAAGPLDQPLVEQLGRQLAAALPPAR